MTEPRLLPRPLQGPLNRRTIFFRASDSPLIERVRGKPPRAVVYFAVAFPLLIALMFIVARFSSQPWMRHLGGNAIELLPMILFSAEVAVIFISMSQASRLAERWQNSHRLPELTLTGVRPLALAQMMLIPIYRPWLLLTGSLFASGAVALVFLDSENVKLLPILGLVLLHSLISMNTDSWVHLALRLGVKGTFRWLRAALAYYLVLGLCLFPFVSLAMGFVLWLWNTTGLLYDEDILVIFLIAPVYVLSWIFRYFFARAFAARIEQAVFPAMEF